MISPVGRVCAGCVVQGADVVQVTAHRSVVHLQCPCGAVVWSPLRALDSVFSPGMGVK